ncbi:uncharacterized protein LOC127593307 isoform X1 [Hippocampus zosterae]|uniref:uncharacterized protein LOC127593307 isoform X1 n=1 Tax=Hippocampus zosterae TaxID=109293 RepID=UPI00223CD436|nr:uncharacterized protein LOC127593307 isoform X1 [Hippocampus zosterae]
MEAESSNVHASYGLGLGGPKLPPGPAQGAPRACEPPDEARPEDPQQQSHQNHKPLFYFPPSQPYLPMQGLQWPLPMAVPVGYNPYYGYPPLGYGMPMIPHYQPNPYMETPTFIMPRSNLHLTDYRRMLNPYYYQAMAYRARRYRYQHSAPAKEVTSSEVQTEPLTSTRIASNPDSGNPGVLNVCPGENTQSGPPGVPPLLVQSDDKRTMEARTPPNGSFVIQTEELTIECCATPVGIQLLHSRENAEVSCGFPTDDGPGVPAEKTHQTCPDIILVESPGETILKLEEESKNHQDAPMGSVVQDMTAMNDLQLASRSVQSQIEQERPVWSIEDTLVPSTDSLTPTEESDGRLHLAEEAPPDEAQTGDTGPSVEDELVCEAEVCYSMEESPEREHKAESHLSPGLGSSHQEDKTQPRQEPHFQEHQDISFESLPTYLPSSSWRADFDRVYVSSRMPPAPKKQNQAMNRTDLEVPSRRRKLELDFRDQYSVRKPKERYKPKGKVDCQSLSDHECCLTRTFNENIFPLKTERLCTRCLAKAGPGHKRKAVPFQQCNQALMSTCDACKSHANKKHRRKGSVPDVGAPWRGRDTEAESSDNSSSRAGLKWRPDRWKRPLGSKQNWEKNYTCDETQPRQLVAWERRQQCPHGIRELDENLPVSPQDKRRHADQLYWTRRWQTAEKSWKTVTANPEGTRSPHLNKHKMSHSQGTHRKDTRC